MIDVQFTKNIKADEVAATLVNGNSLMQKLFFDWLGYYASRTKSWEMQCHYIAKENWNEHTKKETIYALEALLEKLKNDL